MVKVKGKVCDSTGHTIASITRFFFFIFVCSFLIHFTLFYYEERLPAQREDSRDREISGIRMHDVKSTRISKREVREGNHGMQTWMNKRTIRWLANPVGLLRICTPWVQWSHFNYWLCKVVQAQGVCHHSWLWFLKSCPFGYTLITGTDTCLQPDSPSHVSHLSIVQKWAPRRNS